METKRVVVIGYGNPARGDDGLGPALVARLEESGLSDVAFETDYQLSIEHAQLVAEYGTVIFADAAADATDDFSMCAVAESPLDSFVSHGLSPGQVLHLARSCFGVSPEAYLFGIRARTLNQFTEGLSAESEAALEAAAAWLRHFLEARCSPDSRPAEAESGERALSFPEAIPGSKSREIQDARR